MLSLRSMRWNCAIFCWTYWPEDILRNISPHNFPTVAILHQILFKDQSRCILAEVFTEVMTTQKLRRSPFVKLACSDLYSIFSNGLAPIGRISSWLALWLAPGDTRWKTAESAKWPPDRLMPPQRQTSIVYYRQWCQLLFLYQANYKET